MALEPSQPASASPVAESVRRRHVFFLAGFDPRGPGQYHDLYVREFAQHVGRQALDLHIEARERTADGIAWRVKARARPPVAGEVPPASATTGQSHDGATAAHVDQAAVDTVIECLRWDDIVRAHWPRRTGPTVYSWLRTYALYLSSGALRRMWHSAGRRLWVFGLPFLFMVGALVAALCVAALVLGVGRLWPVAWVPALCAAGAAGGLVLYGAARLAKRFQLEWLGHLFAFMADWSRGETPALDPRMQHMAARVASRLQDASLDEVLLVGHSVGGVMALSVAARALRERDAQRPPGGAPAPMLSLLTLGQCTPLLAALPGGAALRADMAELARAPALTWCDVADPGDWASFALQDPLALCDIQVAARQPHRPRLLSPRFHAALTPQTYGRLRHNKRQIHMQYLRAAQRPVAYDYFAITAGPLSLAQRFASS